MAKSDSSTAGVYCVSSIVTAPSSRRASGPLVNAQNVDTPPVTGTSTHVADWPAICSVCAIVEPMRLTALRRNRFAESAA